MFSRFSVKKPYYVFVAVIMILVLGGVSLTALKTNLMPDFSMPYLAVITTDVGASPEQVEEDVSDVLESKLASVSGVNSVQSFSSENYSMIYLEFADGTDMDSALVKVSAAVNEVADSLPDSAGTPTYMQVSMDMMATMYIGLTDSKLSLSELSDLAEDSIVPALERQEGVADVSVAGGVTNTVSIQLDKDKIANVNDGILGETNQKLADSKKKLDKASSQLDSAEKKLKKQQSALSTQESQTENKLGQATSGLTVAISAQTATLASLNSSIAQLQSQSAGYTSQAQSLQEQVDELDEQLAAEGIDEATKAQLTAQREQLAAQMTQMQSAAAQLDTQVETLQKQLTKAQSKLKEYQEQLAQANSGSLSAASGFSSGKSQMSQALSQIQSSRTQVKEGKAQYKSSRKEAIKNSNVDQLVDINTLAQLISSQNLEMPAGYVDDGDDTQWMVKVGESFSSVDELKSLVLTHIDGVGDITVNDVANVVTLSNEGDTYANLNGQDGLVLSVSKITTANTGDVSKVVNAQLDKLEQDNEGLDCIKVMDQGDYITLYVNTILSTLLLGALLAVIVLAVFLRSIKPTIIVAFSIPFSVLFALVIMYFTGLDLNIMTLGAMSLAIGMLVDNSIVVMENIYRLRCKGLSAPAAAAQGASQVGGAVIASTLTTVCVFLPMVFTTGTVRELMVPFALTLSFVLIASLIVALTAVPAVASKLFVHMKPRKEHSGKIHSAYGKALSWCLAHKAPVLLLSVALLCVSAYGAANMGIVMIPEMSSNQISITMEVNEDLSKEEGYKIADQAADIVASQDGVADVGIVDNGFTTNMMTSSVSGIDTYSGTFILYAMIDEDKIKTESQMSDLTDKVMSELSVLDAEVNDSSSMEGMSSLMGSGLTVKVKGEDYDKTMALGDEVVKVVQGIEGYTDVSNGQEDADGTLHLKIDRDKAARLGTSVGQLYQSLAADMKDDATSFTLRDAKKGKLEVKVNDEDYEPITKENLLDWTFEDQDGDEHKLSEIATLVKEDGVQMISRADGAYVCSVTAELADGQNSTLLARQLQPELDKIDVPDGYSVELSGTDEQVQDMMEQMLKLMALGVLLVYLVMVAQFQSLLSPFIIMFSVPLAFTGGLLALMIAGEQISVMSMLGFVILMGTVVNNGIVFVDYANQLRMGGVAKRPALIATGQTRMRPIFMTALTTVFSMCALIFSQDIGAGLERGMALVVAGGLLYATVMTLFVVPVVYDIFSRKPMRPITLDGCIDDDADDAADVIAALGEDARETYEPRKSRKERREQRRARKAAQATGAAADPAVAAASDAEQAGEQDAPAAAGQDEDGASTKEE